MRGGSGTRRVPDAPGGARATFPRCGGHARGASRSESSPLEETAIQKRTRQQMGQNVLQHFVKSLSGLRRERKKSLLDLAVDATCQHIGQVTSPGTVATLHLLVRHSVTVQIGY